MTHAVKMGGRGVLNALVIGGEDLRTALVEPQPGESSGLAGAVHAQHPSVEVDVRHIDVAPFPAAAALEGALRNGKGNGGDVDAVIVSLMPHQACQPEELSSGLAALITQVRASSGAHLILANACTYGAATEPDPGTAVSARLRLRRLNLTLMELSRDLDASILDVDRLITEMGARQACPYPFELSPAAAVAVAGEAARVIGEYGFFEDRPLVAQVPREAG